MDSISRRSVGSLTGIILDWAGTTVDYGCHAPVTVFRAVFEQRGVQITTEQARAPMGLEKKDHIRTIARMPPVAQQWQDVHGQPWTEADIDAMYHSFTPLQLEVLADHANLVPGVLDVVADCRARNLKIGSTTGYSRVMMNVLLPEAANRGYTPDACVCPEEVPAGRPFPWMCYQNAMQLGTYPLATMVKVGDTLPDIAEGLNAGMWTVGITKTGNELGLAETEVAKLPAQELAQRLTEIEQRMRQAGAHFVLETIADLPPVLDEIESRLRRGELPGD